MSAKMGGCAGAVNSNAVFLAKRTCDAVAFLLVFQHMKYASLAVAVATLILSGCSSYVNSPAVSRALKERREAFSDPLISRAFNAKPAIHFPATIAVAANSSDTRDHIRAISAHGTIDTWSSLPQLARVAILSPVLTDERRSDTDPKADLRIREAAAKLHADAVLILSTETQATDGNFIAPLTTLSLGLLPNKRYELISTALAALVDTRTGYIYGTIEKSRSRSGLTMTWGSDDVIRRVRAKVEREAMEKLFADFPAFWRGVVDSHRR
jgi:hypothetical protein